MSNRILAWTCICFFCYLLNYWATAEIAWAEEKTTPLVLEITNSQATLYPWLTTTMELTFTPSSVAIGQDCGMPEMCGLKPCTCGSADIWGECSCNGLTDVQPEVKVIVTNPAIARAAYANGRLTVKGLKPGMTQIKLTAGLPHHRGVSQTVTIKVTPWLQSWVFTVIALCCLIAYCARLLYKNHKTCRSR